MEQRQSQLLKQKYMSSLEDGRAAAEECPGTESLFCEDLITYSQEEECAFKLCGSVGIVWSIKMGRGGWRTALPHLELL